MSVEKDNTKASKQFKDLSLEERTLEATKIRAKYPDRIPVIVTKSEKSSVPTIDKCKFLVPGDLTISQFMHIIRKRVKLQADETIFLFIDGTLPKSSELMSVLYKNHADKTGFLHVIYTGESTFGNM